MLNERELKWLDKRIETKEKELEELKTKKAEILHSVSDSTAKEADYYKDEGEYSHVPCNIPHCPSCKTPLVRYSSIVNDIVWDTVNKCPNYSQLLKWNYYNLDV